MFRNSKKGFTLIELVVVLVILGILAAIIVPIIYRMLETANQSTDNANARLIYNAAAMWFSDNNKADDDLLPSEVNIYLGLSTYPPAKSAAYNGYFSVQVTGAGIITVKTDKPVVFDPASGKMK